MSKKGLGKFVLGASIGAAVSLLFAPKKGTELRKDIKCKLDEFMGNVDKLTVEDIKEEFNKKVEEIKITYSKGVETIVPSVGTMQKGELQTVFTELGTLKEQIKVLQKS